MKLQRRLTALLAAVCLILAMGTDVYAHEAVNMDQKGSITITMKYNGNIVPGGVLTLYRVGEIHQNDGNYSFGLTEEFKDSNVNLALKDMDDSALAGLAEALAAYASACGLSGRNERIGNDGTAIARELELGLYLVVQTEAAEGYYAAAPFLVSVPMNENGSYVYDVNATPKVGLLIKKEPEEPTEPTTPTPEEPTEPTPPTPSIPGDPSGPAPVIPGGPSELTLPQTGQLNWPVPVLAALGLCMLLLGMALRSDQKEEVL